MERLKLFDKNIEKRQWDHLKYLQRMTLALVSIIFILYVTIFLSTLSGNLSQELVQEQISSITKSFLVGTISGLILGLLILIKPYMKKNWDLHIVVPDFLFYQLITTVLIMFGVQFINLPEFSSPAFILGLLLGGLISITAYAGEVKREHSEDEEQEK